MATKKRKPQRASAAELKRYDELRNFDATPEPPPQPAKIRPRKRPPFRFVIHEHHARALHWDLRLERNGVLESWAVPRGIPFDKKTNHLAVRTEDHPLGYLEFEAEIPAGNYGAGEMHIWDSGTYKAEKFRDDEVIAVFNGSKMRGKYVLFKTDENQWMIHRMDPPEDPGREPMPDLIEPMLATRGELPPENGKWAYEVKWDGVRAIAYCDGGRLRLLSRRGSNITGTYPEIRPLAESLGAVGAVLDGEILAFEGELPSFSRLQSRMHVTRAAAISRLKNEIPVMYVIFDLLWLEGHSTASLTYRERRELLETLDLKGPAWQLGDSTTGKGAGRSLKEATSELGLEGIVAKRLDGKYEPGRRSPSWIKVRNNLAQEFVVGGWTSGQGDRSSSLGSLILGYYEGENLRYAGKVGTGMSGRDLDQLAALLRPIESESCPFEPEPPKPIGREATWVSPELVASVRFGEWTSGGVIRHPAYRGLRNDKDPREVVRE